MEVILETRRQAFMLIQHTLMPYGKVTDPATERKLRHIAPAMLLCLRRMGAGLICITWWPDTDNV